MMSPLVTIEVGGHPFRAPKCVVEYLGITEGARVGFDRYHDIKRSCNAYKEALRIIERAHAALFPDPCGIPHLAPDPGCPECGGKGRKQIPMPPPVGADMAHRTENCRTCIQPYPRRPKPRLGGCA